MKNDVIINRYRELVCTALAKAVDDFLSEEQNEVNDKKFKDWVYDCMWFDLLPINRDLFIKGVFKLRDNDEKHFSYLKTKGYKKRGETCGEEK